MEELLRTIAEQLVSVPEEVRIETAPPDSQGVVVYHLYVAKDDVGRVIGKQGRIAKAIRTIMRAGAVRANQKILVEID